MDDDRLRSGADIKSRHSQCKNSDDLLSCAREEEGTLWE